MNRIKLFLARIDELSLRERTIVFGGVLIVLFLGWYSYLMEPLMKEEKRLVSELAGRRGQLTALNGRFEQMTAAVGTDSDTANRKKIDRLNQQIAGLEQDLKAATANLVTPESMPGILREVLVKSRGLTLLKLTGLGGTPLVLKTVGGKEDQVRTGAAGNGDLGAAFKHGMQIEFRGNFFQTLDYMRALEDLKQGFFWDKVKFEVQDYPDSITTLTLYTLSLNQDWIRI